MGQLSSLVIFGASAESRLVRAALVRLCARAGGIGGGMSPFLVPLVRDAGREAVALLVPLHRLLSVVLCCSSL